MTQLRAGAASHVGQIRSNNQDSKLVAGDVALFAVADGMGGHQGGEVASAIAVETLEAIVSAPTHESIVEAVREANRRIFAHATENAELRGMGTTLVGIALINQGTPEEEMAWVNVGDSRVYLLRDGTLHQLSRDHSLVEDLRRGGQLTAEEAAVHPQRNILTRALGIDAEVQVDSAAFEPFQGDRYLLCSDGLFNEVDRDTIIATLSSIEDLDACSEELVRLANQGGGRDNITVVIVDVVDDDGRAARAAEIAAAAAAQLAADRAAAEAAAAEAGETLDTTEANDTAEAGDPAGTTTADDAAPQPAPPGGPSDPDADTDPGAAPTPPAPSPPAAAPADPDATPPAGSLLPAPPAEPLPAAGPPPGRPGFPTEDEAAPDDDLPFGRSTKDVFEDLDAVGNRHRTKVIAGIVIAALLLVVGGVMLIRWIDRDGYFVEADGQTVVVYRGDPGGGILFGPEAVAEGATPVDELAEADQEQLATTPTFGSEAAARSLVNQFDLRAEQAAEAEATPERTTTTTTTTAPGTSGSSTTTTAGGAGTGTPTTTR